MPQLDSDKTKEPVIEGQEPKDADDSATEAKTTEPKEGEEEGTEEEPEGEAEDKGNELPEWAQKERKSLRDEAAKWRTKYRDLETKLTDAKTPEEFQSAVSTFQTEIQELQRKLVIERFELTELQAKRLQGNTLEELEADAKELQELAGVPAATTDPDELGGGLDGSPAPSTDDVKATVKKFRRNRF